MLEDVKKFHKSLPKYTNDPEIAKRLQKVVENAMRNSYYELMISRNPKEVLKDHICSAMIETRAFEKARNKEECLRVAEKVAEDIIKIGGRDLKRFFELYVKWNRVLEESLLC